VGGARDWDQKPFAVNSSPCVCVCERGGFLLL